MIDEKQIKEWAEHKCSSSQGCHIAEHAERRELARALLAKEKRIDDLIDVLDGYAPDGRNK